MRTNPATSISVERPGASRYFVLTTVRIDDHSIGDELLSLRRRLAWDGMDIHQHFHATEDRQAIRDEVFRVISDHHLRVDTTILDKPKTQPHVRATEARFYKTAWYYHMKHVTPRVATPEDEMLVIAASVGTQKKRAIFRRAVEDVMKQLKWGMFRLAYWPAAIDPCLQVADYLSWAVQRKWERGDTRSYDLVKDMISSEYDLFAAGKIQYY